MRLYNSDAEKFEIGHHQGRQFFMCLDPDCKCFKMKSYHPEDIEKKYCSGCGHKSDSRLEGMTTTKITNIQQF